MIKKTIKCSKYNEVPLYAVFNLITKESQIIKSPYANGVYLGIAIVENGKKIKMYSDDSVEINNVRLPLAKGDDSYFDCELSITVPSLQ
jgi:hypothetical protein